ncbi:MAG: MarR family EPS-associated transcriptional regulator [Deltaproteobacteria bacterium]|nr:MarR family EPS-associated transcriptional regulator [Deltaproteobacteria bacterium]
MNNPQDQEIHYHLLKTLSRAPDLTQREIARRMGISLGKVNYCLSELAKSGFIKINRFRASKNKSRYIYLLTPRGIEAKARLTLSFLRRKLVEYEEIGLQIKNLAREIEEQEIDHFYSDDELEWLKKVP